MSTEVMFDDGSVAVFSDGGGGFHSGKMAMQRVRLITAQHALKVYIQSQGRFQLTRNGAQLAIKNVIEPLTGVTYKRSMNCKVQA